TNGPCCVYRRGRGFLQSDFPANYATAAATFFSCGALAAAERYQSSGGRPARRSLVVATGAFDARAARSLRRGPVATRPRGVGTVWAPDQGRGARGSPYARHAREFRSRSEPYVRVRVAGRIPALTRRAERAAQALARAHIPSRGRCPQFH